MLDPDLILASPNIPHFDFFIMPEPTSNIISMDAVALTDFERFGRNDHGWCWLDGQRSGGAARVVIFIPVRADRDLVLTSNRWRIGSRSIRLTGFCGSLVADGYA